MASKWIILFVSFFVLVYGEKQWLQDLQNNLEQAIRKIIPNPEGRKVALLDLPNHWNLGDSFIWLGERTLFKKLGFLHVKSGYQRWNRDKILKSIGPDGIIFLHGGGNFGDLYPKHHATRLLAIKQFPNNTIIILPQSVHYQNQSMIYKDAFAFSKHKNLHIIGRCNKSLSILQANFFQNSIHLAPDAAVMIGTVKPLLYPTKDVIFIYRYGEKDPAYEGTDKIDRLMNTAKLSYTLTDWNLWWYFLQNASMVLPSINNGLDVLRLDIANRMLSQGRVVVSDRLHGVLLGLLLGKPVVALDNSYKKIQSIFETYLKDYTGKDFQLVMSNSLESAIAAAKAFIVNTGVIN